MIVVSLLLILVAVTLLVLGLVGGSSSLLISSIVASLLAAVALVIGARQASAARRAAAVPAGDDVGPTRRAANEEYLEQESALRDAPLAGDEDYDESDRSDAYAAGGRDTEEYLTGPDATQRVQPAADLYDDAAAGRTSSGQAAGPASTGSAADTDADHDYDQAATVIGESRATAADEQSWRREPAAPAFAEDAPITAQDAQLGLAGARADRADAQADLAGAWADRAGAQADLAGAQADLAGARADRAGARADLAGARADLAGAGAAADEFDEPDPDDPDDEPLPQAVRPADAVRVARLDAEVLVVDGRPRYHLADCPHLAGRLTEGLPVAEAVELGFSPCGLCRPVDRLVAAAARR